MGMFDHIRYKGHEYQTKDTPEQWLANYEIREDGTLWLEECDSEWVKDEDHFLGAYIKESNHRWVQQDRFIGEIRFYRNLDKEYKVWEEFSTYFIDGQMKHIVPIDRPSD